MSQAVRWAVIALALAAVGCSTPPPVPTRLPWHDRQAEPATPATGEVLARSNRFVVYVPDGDETLAAIAARFRGSEDAAWAIADFNGITRAVAGQALAVPLRPLNPLGVYGDHYQTVPILCYHRFGSGGGSRMVVSPTAFAAQLDWLARNGYHVIRLAQLADYLEGRQALPRRSVVITIDDGYESVYRHAYPLLRRHGVPATLFVYTDFIGAGDALSWAQLHEMAASGLVDVQAHSKTHRSLIERVAGESDERYRQGLEIEARAPRDLLERRLPVQVRHYAFPYGDANDTLLDVLARQQYRLAVTVNPGGNAFFAQPLMLRRTMIYGDQDLDAFKAKLQTSRPIGVR